MNIRLRGNIGGFCCGGAPRPSGAGSTRQPAGCFSAGVGFLLGGAELSAGESGGKHRMYSPAAAGDLPQRTRLDARGSFTALPFWCSCWRCVKASLAHFFREKSLVMFANQGEVGSVACE